jgi:hypothetical protein
MLSVPAPASAASKRPLDAPCFLPADHHVVPAPLATRIERLTSRIRLASSVPHLPHPALTCVSIIVVATFFDL